MTNQQKRREDSRKSRIRIAVCGSMIVIGLLLFLGSMAACDLGYLHGWWAIGLTVIGMIVTLTGCLLGGVFR